MTFVESTKAGDQKKNLLKGQVPRIKILRTYLSIFFCQNYRVPQRKLKLEVFCNECSQGMHALFFRIFITLNKDQLYIAIFRKMFERIFFFCQSAFIY